jgi:ABC-type multidrug transport system ATPase subunit
MSLLQLEHVSKRYRDEPHSEVLRDVSLAIDEGELAVVWGLRRCGRSTLLRVAAGLEPPSAGVVRFAGDDLARHGERLLGRDIGFCQKMFRFGDGQTAIAHTMVGLLSRWVAPNRARRSAEEALARVGAGHCAGMRQHELSAAEEVRVALARTLTLAPRLIVIDEPVKGVELGDRDGILRLLRELADEGVAVFASTGESTGLSEADQGLVLGGGELRSAAADRSAKVVPLRAAEQRHAQA